MEQIVEIKADELKPGDFVHNAVKGIKEQAEGGFAISALSGGVDSSVVTVLGHMALGKRLRNCFIDTGLMREGEPEQAIRSFKNLGIEVELVNAQDEFFAALAGITDPEERREAFTQTFYKDVFGRIVKESGVKCLLQGTILTDIDETVAGIKRQHNVFKQLGIDPEQAFGYKIIEPLIQLRKDGVRAIAGAVDLPRDIRDRQPFPGPGLAIRIIGPVTKEKVELVRRATVIMEKILNPLKAFQSMAILQEDRVTGMVNGKREFGRIIQIRCWESVDARNATPKELPWDTLMALGEQISDEVPGVVQVTFNLTSKPPSTMEAL